MNKCIGNHPSKQKHSKAIISKQSKQQRIEGENNTTDKEQGGRATRSVDWRVGGFRSERERERVPRLNPSFPLTILLEGIATN